MSSFRRRKDTPDRVRGVIEVKVLGTLHPRCACDQAYVDRRWGRGIVPQNELGSDRTAGGTGQSNSSEAFRQVIRSISQGSRPLRCWRSVP